jgi:excisionase family DNA binding protein
MDRNGNVETWLTIEEAAEYLQCSTRTIRRLALAGVLRGRRLNPMKANSTWRFRRADLDSYGFKPDRGKR